MDDNTRSNTPPNSDTNDLEIKVVEHLDLDEAIG
jgi:hypothetical protein